MSKLFFNLLLGAILPVFCFLSFWWISLIFTQVEKTVEILAFTGLCFGLLTDLIVWRISKIHVYKLPDWMLLIIYVFYSICVFGFFMGVPVFQIFIGLIAGYYGAKKMQYLNSPKEIQKVEINKISRFSTVIMAIISICSAFIALMDKHTAANLIGMFHLPINLSLPILGTAILLGGVFLICLQYWLTKKVMIKTLNYYSL